MDFSTAHQAMSVLDEPETSVSQPDFEFCDLITIKEEPLADFGDAGFEEEEEPALKIPRLNSPKIDPLNSPASVKLEPASPHSDLSENSVRTTQSPPQCPPTQNHKITHQNLPSSESNFIHPKLNPIKLENSPKNTKFKMTPSILRKRKSNVPNPTNIKQTQIDPNIICEKTSKPKITPENTNPSQIELTVPPTNPKLDQNDPLKMQNNEISKKKIPPVIEKTKNAPVNIQINSKNLKKGQNNPPIQKSIRNSNPKLPSVTENPNKTSQITPRSVIQGQNEPPVTKINTNFNPPTNFPCIFCKRDFASPLEVTQHLSSQHLACLPCGVRFHLRNFYKHHVHREFDIFRCTKCNSGFKLIQAFLEHDTEKHNGDVTTEIGEKNKNCDSFGKICPYCTCNLMSSDFSKLENHFNQVHNIELCEICGVRYFGKSKNCIHVLKMGENVSKLSKKEEIQNSEITQITIQNLTSKKSEINEESPKIIRDEEIKIHYPCLYCKQIFDSDDKICDHIKNTHLLCLSCPNEKFENVKKLEKHLKTHTNFYQCSKCIKSFKFLQLFFDHDNSIHGGKVTSEAKLKTTQLQSFTLNCVYCTKQIVTSDPEILQNHLFTSHKVYSCSKCGIWSHNPKNIDKFCTKCQPSLRKKIIPKEKVEVKSFPCLKCSKILIKLEDVSLHYQNTHFYCKFCDIGSPNYESYRDNHQTNSKCYLKRGNYFSCCKNKYKTLKCYLDHFVQEHRAKVYPEDREGKVIGCPYCPEMLLIGPKHQTLNQHLLASHDIDSCVECGVRFHRNTQFVHCKNCNAKN